MAGSTKKYCYRTPKFPKASYLVFVLIKVGEEVVHLHPFYLLEKSLSEIAMDVRLIRDEYESEDFLIDDVVIVIPLTFHSFFPLKRSFWKRPSLPYTPDMRANEFAKILEYEDLFRILITPSLTEVNEEVFAAAMPFYKNTSEKDIERFMYMSDFPVDETAKFAALYEPQKPFDFKWKEELIEEGASLKSGKPKN